MWPGRSSAKTPVRVVIATTTFLSSVSVGRGAALALVELGGAAFFASGVAERAIGPSAPWFVLAAVLVGIGLRAVDLEGCALFVPGGLWGTVKEGLGRPAARLTAAGLLVEHLLLGALSASLAGHYFAAVATMALGVSRIRTNLAAADLATLAAVGLLGAVWWWQREGRPLWSDTLTRIVTAVVALLAGVVCWALIGAVVRGGFRGILPPLPSDAGLQRVLADGALRLPAIVRLPLELLTALGYCLFALGGSDALAHVAPELQQPRILNLRRIARLLSFYALFVTAGAAFAAAALGPPDVRTAWFDAALVAVPAALPGPVWVRVLVALGCVCAIAVLLAGAVLRAALSVQSVLSRLSDEGLLAGTLRSSNRHFGSQSRVIDLVAIAQLTIIVMSAGQVSWLARMYAVGLVCVAFLKIATLIRFRSLRPEPRAFRVPLNVRRAKGEWPVGLFLLASTISVPTALTIAGGDAASIAGAMMIVGFAGLLTASARWVASREPPDEAVDDFRLMPSADLGLDHVEVRPGNLLVAVRRPHFLAHLSAALQAAGDRDIVVMTVRIVGDEVGDDPDRHSEATGAERRLFTAAVAIAERYGRAVRLLIVPATNVFDAVARDRRPAAFVGGLRRASRKRLSADDQARLLGEAWERVPKTEPLDVRLVIHHSSGRTASITSARMRRRSAPTIFI